MSTSHCVICTPHAMASECPHNLCYPCFVTHIFENKDNLCPLCMNPFYREPCPYEFMLVKGETDWPKPEDNCFQFISLAKSKGIWSPGYNIALELGQLKDPAAYHKEIQRRFQIDLVNYLELNRQIKFPDDIKPNRLKNKFVLYQTDYNNEAHGDTITAIMAMEQFKYLTRAERLHYKRMEMLEFSKWVIAVYTHMTTHDCPGGKPGKLYYLLDYVDNQLGPLDVTEDHVVEYNVHPFEQVWNRLTLQEYKKYKERELAARIQLP